MNPANEAHQQGQVDAMLQLRVAALDVAANSIVITDQMGIIQWVNAAFTKLTGYSTAEAIGQNPRVLKSGKHDDQFYSDMWSVILSGVVWRGEVINRRKDGSLYIEEMTITPVRSADGGISNFFAVKEDITARKQAEDALRSSQAKLQGIISSAMDAVISVDEQQRIVVFNRAAESVFQYAATDAVGSTLDRFIPSSLRETHSEHIRRFGSAGITARSMNSPGILTAVRASGEEFPIEATISQVETDGAKLYTVILRDVTERKRAEEVLREQANLLDLAHDAIMVRSLDGRIRFWNHGAEEMYGYSKQEATGNISHDLLHTVFAQPLAEIEADNLRSGRWNGELIHTTHGGTRIVVASRWVLQRDTKGQPCGVMEINYDITLRKKTEQALIRSEKLASVGRLAATIAHEINNPLSSALNALYLVRTDPVLPESLKSHLTLAQQELRRVAHITKQTLGFYKEIGNPTAVDVSRVLDSLLDVFEPRLRNKNISVQRSYRCSAGISAIEGEVYQIVSNLVANSIDALPQGGKLHVRLFGPQSLREYRRTVRMTIADDGEGIAAENLKEIFEPFFTTKQSIGTGLGLWVTSELVKKHEGKLRLRSRLGKGTVVTIWLPIERRGPERRSA